MNITKILIITIATCLATSSLALTSELSSTNPTTTTLTFTPTTNITHFYKIKATETFSSITITNHEMERIKGKPHQTKFETTDSTQPLTTPQYCPATQPMSYEVLKKGYDSILKIYIPSEYFHDSEKRKTISITLQINLKPNPNPLETSFMTQKSHTFTTQNYTTQDVHEYVIITNESFYDILRDYFKSWKISTDNKITNIIITNVSTILNDSDYDVNGTYGDGNTSNSWIGESPVTSSWEMFNDTQAHIRNYLRWCYDACTTRYVLIFGNSDVVPPRMVCSYAAGTCPGCTDFHNDTSHASDMYYSNLHYNMNNNTNSYWMENAVCGSPVDQIDWGFDINVGRVLINQKFEAFWWINKTKNYVNGNNQSNYTKWAAVPCKNGGNSISNQTWTGWTDSSIGPNIGDEFPSNISFINNQNITQAQWDQLANYANGNAGGLNGLTLIYHTGHGGTLWTPYSDSNLDNMHIPNFIYTEGCTSANFGEDRSSRMEDWMSNNGAAFGGIANSAFGWFVASTYYGEQMMSELFNSSNTSVFCTAHNRAREKIGHSPDCVWGQIYKSANFFGDPSLEWTWHQVESPQIISIDSKGNNSFIYSPTPTFNWTKTPNTPQYHLQIATDSSFTTIVTNINNINTLTYPLYCTEDTNNITFILPPGNALSSFNTYYCKVKSYGRV